MALLLDLLVTGQTRLNDDTYAKNIYADKFVRTGSSDSYVLLGGGGHKLLSDFSMSHSHPYLPLAGGEMSGSIIMNRNYIVGVSESGGGMIRFDGTRTVIGSIGASSTASTHIRTKDAVLTVGSGNAASYTVLHTGNSSVSGGGSTWGSSITVKINGTSKTLTIPSNPNTDSLVQQSKTTTANFRPLLMGYTNASAGDAALETDVTNVSYVSLKFYAQPSTGKLYATEFVGNLSGTSTQTSKIYINNSSGGSVYPVLFTNLASAGTPRYDYVYVDSASGTGYNPSTNAFVASVMTAGTHNSTSTLYISSGNSSSIIFLIGGVEKARFLQPNGYLGIGIKNPSYPLSVSGTIHTTTGFNANGRAVIDSTGRFSPTDTSYRNAGVYGVYDSHKVGHVWSMGTSYSIAADGSSTGNLYGLAYFHTNWSNSADYNKDGKTEVSTYAGGHQIAMIVSGQVNASLGSNIWSRGGFIKNGSSNDYALMGGGGHKNISNVQNTAFYKRIVTVNGSGYDMAGTTSSAAFTIYAPTAAGTSGQVLKSTGGTPTWINQSDIIAGSANNTDILNIKSINSETDIVQSGIRGYAGSGSSWTGSIRSMGYAAIFSFGNPNRGWQLWAGRTGEVGNGLCWRRGIQAATSWDSERLILDSDNYTGYTVKKDGTGASGTWGISITGNADTVDNQHFAYSNSSDSPTYLWATNSNGTSFLAARANISVNYANSAGNADTVGNKHASDFALLKTWNNLIHSGNEFTFVSPAFTGDVWLNYRTSSGSKDGSINSYYFGDGKGESLAYISKGYFSGNAKSATYATSAGSVAWNNVSSKPDTATRWPAWSEVTNKPSSFTPSSHTHDYLPLSGGIMTGPIRSDSGYVIMNPIGASYHTTANKVTGCITINLPASVGNTMVSMWIDVYIYETQKSFSVHCGGYTYTNTTWKNSPFAIVYGANHRVRLGHNGTQFVVYIGETNTSWTYPQVSVRNVTLGFSPTLANWAKAWSVSFSTSVSNVTYDTTTYAWTTKNLSKSDFSAASHNHDTVYAKKDGTGASGTWGINITGSAGSVAWGNVTGKPSTFTPSSHTHDSRYLRKDTNDSTEYQYSFTKTDGHAIQVGTIKGRGIGSLTGQIIHIYERVHIGSSEGWGSRDAPSNGLSTYGGAWLATDKGNVGIGTTSPTEKLHVKGSANITGPAWLNNSIYIIDCPSISTLQSSYGLPSNYTTEDFLKAWTKFARGKVAGRTVIGYIHPNSRGMIQADVYSTGINSSSGLPEHITGRYYPHAGSEIIFGTSYGTWYYRKGIDSGNISSQSVSYASNAGNADTVDGQHFAYSNDSNSPTYLWGTNNDGSTFLAARASMSVSYASSAGSVAWGNVTGKPSSFTPSSHNHDTLYPKKDGTGASGTWSISITGSSGSCTGNSAKVTVNNSNSNSSYRMVWHSSNTLYSTAGIYCNPSSDALYASAFYETSDERLKDFENVIDIDFNIIRAIPKKYFRWKERPNDLQIGTSAQVVQKFYPEIVTSTGDGFLNVDYSKLSIIALSAIDKLHLENQDLKHEINLLKQEIQALKKDR